MLSEFMSVLSFENSVRFNTLVKLIIFWAWAITFYDILQAITIYIDPFSIRQNQNAVKAMDQSNHVT